MTLAVRAVIAGCASILCAGVCAELRWWGLCAAFALIALVAIIAGGCASEPFAASNKERDE
jgi:hypothetical protein